MDAHDRARLDRIEARLALSDEALPHGDAQWLVDMLRDEARTAWAPLRVLAAYGVPDDPGDD